MQTRPADGARPLALTAVVALAQAACPRLDGRPQAGVAGDVARPPSLLGARPAGGGALGPLGPRRPALLAVQRWWEAQGAVRPLPPMATRPAAVKRPRRQMRSESRSAPSHEQGAWWGERLRHAAPEPGPGLRAALACGTEGTRGPPRSVTEARGPTVHAAPL